jgi:flagellar hook-length control protein FliK
MLSIEQNPTHIQTEAHPGLGPPRFEGLFRKKGRKNDALGVFSKLLAGLTKKTGPGPEANLIPQETAVESGQKNKPGNVRAGKFVKTTKNGEFQSPGLWEQKGREAGEKNEALIRRNGFQEPVSPFVPVQTLVTAADEALHNSRTPSSSGSFDPDIQGNPVSRGSENSRNSRELPQGKIPFQNQDMPDLSSQEIRNAALRFTKADKPPAGENRTETRRNERRRDRVSLEVQDLRTPGSSELAARGLKGVEEVRNSAEGELILDLRPGGEGSAETPAEMKMLQTGENFEQILARELNGDLSADIVKQAAIVLRDGGEGTIKLSLKPESLGKVKIHLEMAENKISGYIVVETAEALRAFEQEIHTLEQAFRDSGFESATLNAALDYRNSGQQWKEDQASPFFSRRFAGTYDSGSGVKEVSGGYTSGFGLPAVNLLV